MCSEPDGSSPQVRGTLLASVLRPSDGRFIPAGAGNTSPPPMPRSANTVHPRRCGEHVPGLAGLVRLPRFIPAGAGNTIPDRQSATPAPVHPRRCGEHVIAVQIGADCARFIPAGAGNTAPAPDTPPRRPVHPRRCGEHNRLACLTSNGGGSSPQVRGTPV